MLLSVRHSEGGLGIPALLSVLLHGAVAALLVWWQQFAPPIGPIQTTYYVDIVNLPVAHPQTGSPVPTGDRQAAVAAAPVTLPAASLPRPAAGKTPAAPGASADFEERLASLEGAVDSRRQAAAIAALRQKVTQQAKAGMPNGGGAEAGSDYLAYLHSRLKDSFRNTISYQTREPYVMVRLTIDGDGRIIRTRFERSSGDRVFELSVSRAIVQAERALVPPPGRAVFEGAFMFKPQGVSQQ